VAYKVLVRKHDEKKPKLWGHRRGWKEMSVKETSILSIKNDGEMQGSKNT
jgi:hypothetical protein